jgi:hypothetical protein
MKVASIFDPAFHSGQTKSLHTIIIDSSLDRSVGERGLQINNKLFLPS